MGTNSRSFSKIFTEICYELDCKSNFIFFLMLSITFKLELTKKVQETEKL